MSTSDFDSKYDIVDAKTPRHTFMCGHYKQSFAHFTLRERLPVTLTTIIDGITIDKDEISQEYGGNSREEIKHVVGLISKLKYQLQTDKQLECFEGIVPDKEMWNNFIMKLSPNQDSFFKICWLYAECYMYRKLYSFIEKCTFIKGFDYFAKQKINAAEISTNVMEVVAESTRNLDNNLNTFRHLLKLNLWGNRCDLSLTSGKEVKPTENSFEIIEKLDANIVIDDALHVWHTLAEMKTEGESKKTVDIICDNAGYELFTDFILAEYIIDKKLAEKVHFHVKAIPWFVSDVTPNDFHWMLKWLKGSKSRPLNTVGIKWSKMLDEGSFEVAPVEYFWTSPYEFHRMPEISPKLYERLSEAQLLIFKGDLNYRKLIGDFTWDFTESFETCLQGFQPSNLCALRTVKADLICGLREGQADELFKRDPSWMLTGEYGVIQFAKKPTKLPN